MTVFWISVQFIGYLVLLGGSRSDGFTLPHSDMGDRGGGGQRGHVLSVVGIESGVWCRRRG